MTSSAIFVVPTFNRMEEYLDSKVGVFIDDVPLLSAVAMGRIFAEHLDINLPDAESKEFAFVMPKALRELEGGEGARMIYQTQCTALSFGYHALRSAMYAANPELDPLEAGQIMEAMQLTSLAVQIELTGKRSSIAIMADACRRAWYDDRFGVIKFVAELVLDQTGGESLE